MKNATDERTPQAKPTPSPGPDPEAGETAIHKLLAGFKAALGFGASKTPIPPTNAIDTGTRLAYERTSMATDRTYWAAERTLMGWIRTALSMISFGFTIGKLGQTLQEIQVPGFRGVHMIGIDSIAYFLVMLGTGALLAAAVQYSRRVHELCKQGLKRQQSIEFWVALVLSLMGIVAFGTLVLNV